MKHVAVLTSGGDAPGMNAAIRAIVRCGVERGWRMSGVEHGFRGLVDGKIRPLGRHDVGGVIHQGGTFLGSARYEQFATVEIQRQAVRVMAEHAIDALVIIGGNGTQTGAHALSQLGSTVVGIASTIDNDLVGSDITIGSDTALNVALESIDRLRTTAVSHRRVVLVEVMGRSCGFLALMLGIAGGAEAITVPEGDTTLDELVDKIKQAHVQKDHALVVVAEGARLNAVTLGRALEARDDIPFAVRSTVLGHVQRGGVPSAFDRLLGSRFGNAAIEALAAGQSGILIGLRNGAIGTTPLADVAGRTKHPDPQLMELALILAR